MRQLFDFLSQIKASSDWNSSGKRCGVQQYLPARSKAEETKHKQVAACLTHLNHLIAVSYGVHLAP